MTRRHSREIHKMKKQPLTFEFIMILFHSYTPEKYADGKTNVKILKFRRKDDTYIPVVKNILPTPEPVPISVKKFFIDPEELLSQKKQLSRVIDIKNSEDSSNLVEKNRIAREYFEYIYTIPEHVVPVIIENKYKADHYITNVKKSSLSDKEKHDIIYFYVYEKEKENYEYEYSEANEYFLKYYDQDLFKKTYDKYYTSKTLANIRKSIYIRNSFKTKLMLIELYKIVNKKELEHRAKLRLAYGKKYNDFVKKIGKDIEKEYDTAIKYFSEKYKYSDYLNMNDYIDFLIQKYSKDTVIKDIRNSDKLTELSKKLLSVIYVMILDQDPTSANIGFSISLQLNNIIKYPICIPLLDSTCVDRRLNYKYKQALEYFSNKYGKNMVIEINKLRNEYVSELSSDNQKHYRENLIKLMELNKYRDKLVVSKQKIVKYFQDKYKVKYTSRIEALKTRYFADFLHIKNELNELMLLEYIDKLENRLVGTIYDIANKYYMKFFKDKNKVHNYIERRKILLKDKIQRYVNQGYYELDNDGFIIPNSFKIRNFDIDKELYNKICMYIIYVEDIKDNNIVLNAVKSEMQRESIIREEDRLYNVVHNMYDFFSKGYKTLQKDLEKTEKKLKANQEKQKKLEEESQKLSRNDFFGKLYTNAYSGFISIYKTSDEASKKIDILEKKYNRVLQQIKRSGIIINSIFYNNLTEEQFRFIKVYFLYEREKEENILKEQARQQERRDLINNLYENADNNLLRIYKTRSSVNERLKILEKNYKNGLEIVNRVGLEINSIIYKNFTEEEFSKIKIYYLYTKEREEQIIEEDYNTAMNYFDKTYGRTSDMRIDTLERKYKHLIKVEEEYPPDVRDRYNVYRYYMYDIFERKKDNFQNYGPLDNVGDEPEKKSTFLQSIWKRFF